MSQSTWTGGVDWAQGGSSGEYITYTTAPAGTYHWVASDYEYINNEGGEMPQRRNNRTVDGICLSQNDQIRLIRILHSLFEENPQLEDLKSNITFDKVSTNGSINPIGKLTFRDTDNPDAQTAIMYNREYGYSAIRFSKFSPRDITNRTLYAHNRESVGNFWSNIYNQYWEERNTARRFGVNILKKIAIKGYILNFNDVRKLIDENLTSRRYDTILDNINEFYYFSDRNCLLGIATTNGSLLIRMQAMKKILDQNDDTVVKKCLKNLFVCFNKVLIKFMELNVREVHTEVAECVQQSVLNKLINGTGQYNRRFYRYTDGAEDREGLQRNIENYIKDCLTKAFEGSVFGANDTYSYASVLNKIIKARRGSEKDVFKQGFSKGMRIGLKFEMMGWEPANPNWADSTDQASMWWEKEVNLKPSSFVKGGKRYLIPESERTFSVKKLYINQDGRMRADANHPNVTGSNVCMGDLQVDFSDESFDLQEMLVRVEELLDMINYDSAYRSENLEHLMEVSEIQDSLFSENESSIKDKVRKASSIRELDGSFDDDEDEDEEEISEEEAIRITHVSDNNGHHIADITNYNAVAPVRNADDEDDDEDDYYDENPERSQQIEILERQPVIDNATYEINESIVVNDISTVHENGTRRPLVFNMGVGTQVSAPVGGFALGDDNLIGGNNNA